MVGKETSGLTYAPGTPSAYVSISPLFLESAKHFTETVTPEDHIPFAHAFVCVCLRICVSACASLCRSDTDTYTHTHTHTHARAHAHTLPRSGSLQQSALLHMQMPGQLPAPFAARWGKLHFSAIVCLLLLVFQSLQPWHNQPC